MAASKVYRLIWRAMPALAAGLLGGLLGCASRGSDALPTDRADNPQPPAGAPSLADLQQQLDAEFLRLGVDPTKVTAAAPQGARNAVFDLKAQAVDADGQPWTPGDAGADPPAGIELRWTERLLGDYDQNGEVNGADLAPIAARFLQTVSYDDPALHGGFTEWPSGEPEGSGAANWRDARVDGDGNGEINAADIATIAAHWLATLSGYRVYARAPSGDYTMLPNPDEPAPLTLHRPADRDNTLPVRYTFTYVLPDQPDGMFQFYVAGYDAPTTTEGPASSAVAVNVLTGEVQQPPVALLTVSPDYGGVPLKTTFDGSDSTADGSITEYRFDVEGDGVVDWTSVAELPEQSSSGAAMFFTSADPQQLSAEFFTASAEYYRPTLTVVDSAGLVSAPASAQLGVSGWEHVVLNPTPDSGELTLEPQQLSSDPASGALVAACVGIPPGGTKRDVCFARRVAPGQWEIEPIDLEFPDPMWTEPRVASITWDELAQPVMLINRIISPPLVDPVNSVWSAQRSTNGSWTLVEQIASGEKATIHGDPALVDGNAHWLVALQLPTGGLRYDIVSFINDTWNREHSGYNTTETAVEPVKLMVEQGKVFGIFKNTIETPGIWRARYEPGAGLVSLAPLDEGQLEFENYTRPRGAISTVDQSVYVLHDATFQSETKSKLVRIKGSAVTLIDLAAPPGYSGPRIWLPHSPDLREIANGVSFFATLIGRPSHTNPNVIEDYYFRLSLGVLDRELLAPSTPESTESMSFIDSELDKVGQLWAILRSRPPDVSGWQYKLCWRVDPRE